MEKPSKINWHSFEVDSTWLDYASRSSKQACSGTGKPWDGQSCELSCIGQTKNVWYARVPEESINQHGIDGQRSTPTLKKVLLIQKTYGILDFRFSEHTKDQYQCILYEGEEKTSNFHVFRVVVPICFLFETDEVRVQGREKVSKVICPSASNLNWT